MEELFKKTQVSAGPPPDNEKLVYQYQVEALKDDLQELEENFTLLQKDHREKTRAHDLMCRDHAKLKEEHKLLQEMLAQREKLIEEHGLLIIGIGEEEEEDDEVDAEPEPRLPNGTAKLSEKNSPPDASWPLVNGHPPGGGLKSILSNGPTLISKDVAELIEAFEGPTLAAKLKNLLDEREDMVRELRRLKLDLEDERTRYEQFERRSMSDVGSVEGGLRVDESETKKMIHEYKFNLKKAEQEIIVLQSNVSRLETQVSRYKLSTEEAEKLENELKTEKRKILRDLREAQSKAEELETANTHLQKRIDKLKNTKLQIINS